MQLVNKGAAERMCRVRATNILSLEEEEEEEWLSCEISFLPLLMSRDDAWWLDNIHSNFFVTPWCSERRRLANREAARRMRRRRATHMQAVEEEVERLSNENSLLLHRMSQLVASHQQVDAENQQLRHELHALRQSVVSSEQGFVNHTSSTEGDLRSANGYMPGLNCHHNASICCYLPAADHGSLVVV